MRQLTQSALLRRCAPLLAAVSLSVPLTVSTAAADEAPRGALWLPTTASPTGEYVTRPDIEAQGMTTTSTGEETPGLLFTTPNPDDNQAISKGAIYDQEGELVWWSSPAEERAHFDMEPITWQGEPALMMWDGRFGGPSDNPPRYVILDDSYQEVASFAMTDQYRTDGHDAELSEDGSHILLMTYVAVPYDLSEWGGPADARVVDTVVQERDTETGEVTFEWSALDHVPVDETLDPITPEQPPGGVFDLFHFNSLDYDSDGNMLFSARSTSTVYKVDHDNGEILWRLGGENNDFDFADPADMPSAQHDARRLPDGRISVFDNGNYREPPFSRASYYELDEENMTGELVEAILPAEQIFAGFAGSVRELGNDRQLVTFGATGTIKEFDDGEEVFTAELEDRYLTYRAELADWHATPTTEPDVALGVPSEEGTQTMYMSWNGATDVAGWLIEAGPSEDELYTVGYADRAGFETGAEFTPSSYDKVYQITALGRFGQPLSSTTLTP
ncbi:arylsulfotransferase family protein [Streptomyces sp. B6B3]|uniref:arylsulfotransferase family protein n=1 Tax=Streptomyces sp. B6B3 TaxID=3153570 RepID=UPI00325D1416